MKCTNCNHEQASGKFCGKCGSELQAVVAENADVTHAENETAATVESTTVAQPAQPAQPNEQVELVKETSKKYIAYVKEYALNPSQIFTKPENQFTNALITLAIILLLASFTVYSTIKGILKAIMADFMGFGFGDLLGAQMPGVPFFSIFAKTFMIIGFLIGLSALLSLAVLKISKQPLNFKQIVSMYGTLLIPIIGLVVLSYLLILINSIALGIGLLTLAILISVYLYPIIIVSRNFSGELKIDVVHRGLMYFGGYSIVVYVIFSQYMNNKVGPLKDVIFSLFDDLMYF